MLAAPTYAGQLCFTSFEECNMYSPCAYLHRNCSASLASNLTSCTSGPANLNSSNLAQLDMTRVVNTSAWNGTATITTTTSTTDDVAYDFIDQFVCDAVNEDFVAIPGASGLLCYANQAACQADPLNPCGDCAADDTASCCALDLTWCGSGMALAFGLLAHPPANNSWACTALQVPNGTLPQGNEFQCFDTQEQCGACLRFGYRGVASSC